MGGPGLGHQKGKGAGELGGNKVSRSCRGYSSAFYPSSLWQFRSVKKKKTWIRGDPGGPPLSRLTLLHLDGMGRMGGGNRLCFGFPFG